MLTIRKEIIIVLQGKSKYQITPSETCTGAETQLQCIQLNSNEIQASVIPEPPSSPILLPLSDDDQESTPSLGLGVADDDDDDDELEVNNYNH